MIRALPLMIAGLLATPLSAQDFSQAEQDAMAERALSPAEITARETSCALDFAPQSDVAADGTYIINLPANRRRISC